jgi:hypothetical protein
MASDFKNQVCGKTIDDMTDLSNWHDGLSILGETLMNFTSKIISLFKKARNRKFTKTGKTGAVVLY